MEPTGNKIGRSLEQLITAGYPECRIYVKDNALLRYKKAAVEKGIHLIYAKGVPPSTTVRMVSPDGKLLARVMNNGEIRQELVSTSDSSFVDIDCSPKFRKAGTDLSKLESSGSTMHTLGSQWKHSEDSNVSSKNNQPGISPLRRL